MNDRKTASRPGDGMTSYSSKGPAVRDYVVKPHLVAPGNAIISAQAVGSKPGGVLTPGDPLAGLL